MLVVAAVEADIVVVLVKWNVVVEESECVSRE